MASRVPVWSMTCAVSGGIGCKACAAAGPASTANTHATRSASRITAWLLLRAEVHCRWLGNLRLVLHRENRFRLVAEHHAGQVGGEAACQHVVVLHGLDV